MSTVTAIVDGHNDLAWEMRGIGYDFARRDIAVPQPDVQTDLPRLRAGGVGGQFWSVFVPCGLSGADAVTATLEQIDAVYEMIERYPDDLALVTSAEGLAASIRAYEETGGRSRIASLMGAEGGHSIDNSLGVLRNLYRLGVRYLTLTHNENTAWADSATDAVGVGGLSAFGRIVVREMNRLGMMVDLSHVAASTMHAALDVTRSPVIFSHSSARAVCDHPRNVPDDVLTRLADNDGICMVTFVPSFVSPQVRQWHLGVQQAAGEAGVDDRDLSAMATFTRSYPEPQPRASLEDVVAHCEHVREVAGIDHIGLGGDYDGVARLPAGLEDVSAYPRLLESLSGKGWSSSDLAKLGHGNLCRVFAVVEQRAGELRRGEAPSLATLAVDDADSDSDSDSDDTAEVPPPDDHVVAR